MDKICSVLSSKAAATATGAALGAAYLDAALDIVHDLRKIRIGHTIQARIQKHTVEDRRSLYDFFVDAVNKWPNNDYLVYETETLTFAQADKAINRVANWLLSQGVQRGQYICMNIHNTPSHPIWWFACMSIGVFPSFINFNQTGQVLKHSISIADPVLIVFDIAVEENMSTVAEELKAEGYRIVRWIDHYPPPHPTPKTITDIPELHVDDLHNVSDQRVDPQIRKGVSWDDTSALIYTSGTTGLPKGALCSHAKIAKGALNWSLALGLRSNDRILSVLPLYHSTGTILLVSPPIMTGCAVIIVRKFSATKYFDEARKYGATTAHYIGELPRYVLSTPPRPDDKDHKVRLISGNGMRPEVWTAFKERFGIGEVHEFFGATEGTTSIINNSFGPYGTGAIAKRGLLLRYLQRNDIVLAKIDPDTEEPVRDSNGLVMKAANDEPGELVCKIEKGGVLTNYNGYHKSESATNKKILRDVIKKGDEYFRFGDLIKQQGPLMYFVDRLGDTFRWKSENVSTAEVQAVLDAVVPEANVYGVQLPNHDGRAGCFAITQRDWDSVDKRKVAQHVLSKLPNYSRPLFVRVVPEVEVTGTNKHQKVKLRKEGVNPNEVKDPIYWLKGDNYVPFSVRDWDTVVGGKVKL